MISFEILARNSSYDRYKISVIFLILDYIFFILYNFKLIYSKNKFLLKIYAFILSVSAFLLFFKLKFLISAYYFYSIV